MRYGQHYFTEKEKNFLSFINGRTYNQHALEVEQAVYNKQSARTQLREKIKREGMLQTM